MGQAVELSPDPAFLSAQDPLLPTVSQTGQYPSLVVSRSTGFNQGGTE